MNRSGMIGVFGLVAVAAVAASVALAAEDKVAKLAKEGYWGKQPEWNVHSKLLGKPAPALELTDWRGNKAVTADAMKGKVVVVDFWATWCGPCKRAVPHNNELVKKYGDKLVVVGACGGGGEENMNAVADETKMGYPTGKAKEEVTQAWGVQWWPHYVVVDQKGIVRAIGITPDTVEKVVDALLEQ